MAAWSTKSLARPPTFSTGLRRPVECPENHDSLELAWLDSIQWDRYVWK